MVKEVVVLVWCRWSKGNLLQFAGSIHAASANCNCVTAECWANVARDQPRLIFVVSACVSDASFSFSLPLKTTAPVHHDLLRAHLLPTCACRFHRLYCELLVSYFFLAYQFGQDQSKLVGRVEETTCGYSRCRAGTMDAYGTSTTVGMHILNSVTYSSGPKERLR